MTWRLRITASAVVICIILTLLMGIVGAQHAFAKHPSEWWFALLFLAPSIAALIGIYAPGDVDE